MLHDFYTMKMALNPKGLNTIVNLIEKTFMFQKHKKLK